MDQRPLAFWSVPATDLLGQLGATPRGAILALYLVAAELTKRAFWS